MSDHYTSEWPLAGDPPAVLGNLTDAWGLVYSNASRPQRSWLRNSRLIAIDQGTAMVAVPNEFTQSLVAKMRDLIEQILTDCFEHKIRMEFVINPDLSLDDVRLPLDGYGEALGAEPATPTLVRDEQPRQPTNADAMDGDSRLNPRYSFETFVIGSSNRFAHAAAVAVAEAPGKSYNPLLVYGQSGLGKTHLLHALGHYVRSYYDRVRVRYVTTEELTNEFINAISQNRIAEFRAHYRHVDVLLIDDIQFLESKDRTQEEFFHTFNTLHNAQKQIVMTSDRPPKLLDSLTPRLRSRFEMGLITDVQPPDLETRIAILRKKAAHERLAIDADVLEFIGSRIQTNIRELEGALIRVTAFASLNRQPADLAMAETVLRDLIPVDPVNDITPRLIISETARYFDLDVDELRGTSRAAAVARPRQIAMYLCRELTDLSLPKIAKEFNKDHSTVLYAVNKISGRLAEDRNLYNQVAVLTSRIKQEAAIR